MNNMSLNFLSDLRAGATRTAKQKRREGHVTRTIYSTEGTQPNSYTATSLKQ